MLPPCGSQCRGAPSPKIISLKMCASVALTSSRSMPCASMYPKSSRRAPDSHAITRSRLRAQSTSGINSGSCGAACAKCAAVRRAFSASHVKSSSFGKEISTSDESHSRSYSGKKYFSVLKVVAVRRMSRGAQRWRDGCWTLTATRWPVSLMVARWTWASEAAPMGSRENSEK